MNHGRKIHVVSDIEVKEIYVASLRDCGRASSPQPSRRGTRLWTYSGKDLADSIPANSIVGGTCEPDGLIGGGVRVHATEKVVLGMIKHQQVRAVGSGDDRPWTDVVGIEVLGSGPARDQTRDSVSVARRHERREGHEVIGRQSDRSGGSGAAAQKRRSASDPE